MHDGLDGRATRMTADASNAPADRQGLEDLVAAFQQVAAGVEGTHRVLLERVEELSRELDTLRSGTAGDAALACDGETMTLADIERRTIMATLDRFGGHRDRTARALGIGVRTLGMKLRQWKTAGLVPANA